MDKFTQLRTFVRLAERSSFSAVARDLSTSQPAVSKAISALESKLGVRLVNRSTRSVSLTEAGRSYYERCRQILADLDEADAALAEGRLAVTGILNIAAPVPFGLAFISPRVARFKATHPNLAINLMLDDRPADLVEQNIDVAIRLGHLATPGLAARKLGDSPVLLVASPAYLASAGTPTAPTQLASHNCLAYSNQSRPLEWHFRKGGRPMHVTVSSNYQSNNLLALKDATIAGAGIARLPQWMVDAEMRSGLLQPVLDKVQLQPFAIHAVFPSVRKIPLKVTRFVDFIQEELASISYFLGTTPPVRKA